MKLIQRNSVGNERSRNDERMKKASNNATTRRKLSRDARLNGQQAVNVSVRERTWNAANRRFRPCRVQRITSRLNDTLVQLAGVINCRCDTRGGRAALTTRRRMSDTGASSKTSVFERERAAIKRKGANWR